MNNNTIIIASYLQNEMSEEERAAFEQQLATDVSLREELTTQQLMMQAAMNAGIKTEISTAVQKYQFRKKLFRWSAFVIVAAIIIAGYFIIKQMAVSKQHTVSVVNKTSKPFIMPPAPQADIPFSQYRLFAEKGDTILHSGGSVLYFPPSAFTNAAGEIIKGEVVITYREFKKPVDFFVSGIPMQYDSAGTSYIFESSGMCEMVAYQDNELLSVNQAARPEIFLSSDNSNPLHNLYYLDTANRRWDYIGKDAITDVAALTRHKPEKVKLSNNVFSETDFTAVKPVMPLKRDDEKQAFSIEVEPGSFEELFAYDRLKFQVMDESNYRRSDATEHWDNVVLERTDKTGIYNITFSNSNRKVTYKVQPVVEGDDYVKALNEFKTKEKKYETLLKQRKDRELQEKDSLENLRKKKAQQLAIQQKTNDSINAIIEWRNGQLALMRSDTSITGLTSNILRSFSINRFGIWNCDHPQFPNQIPISADFKNHLNEQILLPFVAVVYQDFNGIMQFSPPSIRLIPGKQNMIWAIKNKEFYYFSYADFAKAAISRDTRTFIFKMNKAAKPVNSYEDIKALTEQLSE